MKRSIRHTERGVFWKGARFTGPTGCLKSLNLDKGASDERSYLQVSFRETHILDEFRQFITTSVTPNGGLIR